MISPTVRRRRLAAELRTLREAAGLSNDQLGRKLRWSKSKVSRLENDYGPPSAVHVSQYLDALGTETDKWHDLMTIAQQAAERGWWSHFGEHMGERQQVNADLEWGAETVTEYMTGFIPGLLQTAEYTKARFIVSMQRGDHPSTVDVDQAVAARKARQRMMRRSGGPEYEVILDELTVRRPTAPRGVMFEQVRELIRVQAEEPPISIRVLPIEAEVKDYWLPLSSFSRYTYRDPGDPTVVFVETEAEDLILSRPDQVKPHEVVLKLLRASALSPDDSTELLCAAADRLKATVEKS